MPVKRKSTSTPKTLAVGKHRFILPTPEEDRKITAAALSDPDAQPLTDEQLKSMVPLRSIRGRPKLEKPKVLVSIRYSPEVLEYFKSQGQGWQSRIDEVLRDYVRRQVSRNGD